MASILRKLFRNTENTEAAAAQVPASTPAPKADEKLARPDPDEPFTQGLLRTANALRQEVGLAPSASVAEAASFVVTSAVVDALKTAGQPPGARFIDLEEAAIGAAFLCVACVPIIYHLDLEGHKIAHRDLIANVGFTVYEMYSEQAAVNIVHAGIEHFQNIVAAAQDYQNIKEWNDDVSMVMWAYAKTGDQNYVPMLAKLYRSLFEAQRS